MNKFIWIPKCTCVAPFLLNCCCAWQYIADGFTGNIAFLVVITQGIGIQSLQDGHSPIIWS